MHLESLITDSLDEEGEIETADSKRLENPENTSPNDVIFFQISLPHELKIH